MGNCIETCWHQQELEKAAAESHKDESKEERSSYGVRVKVVLTKEELEWLLIQLKNEQGQRFEELLDAIERSRSKPRGGVGWRPSLESITECPEVPEHMDR